jgi:hypothetical protein
MAEVRLQKVYKEIECRIIDIMDEHLDAFPV